MSTLDKYNFEYGNCEYYFQIQSEDRKNIRVDILPTAEILVISPNNISITEVCNYIKSRKRQISRKVNFYIQHNQTKAKPRKFNSGETIHYLGKQYRLKIVEDCSAVLLNSGRLLIPKCSYVKKRQLVRQWYLEKAHIYLYNKARLLSAEKEPYIGTTPEMLKIQEMKTKWGSCTNNKIITLNPWIILASPKHIEYVIYHELCHLKHVNHTQEYYKLLSKLTPNHVQAKQGLEDFMNQSAYRCLSRFDY